MNVAHSQLCSTRTWAAERVSVSWLVADRETRVASPPAAEICSQHTLAFASILRTCMGMSAVMNIKYSRIE